MSPNTFRSSPASSSISSCRCPMAFSPSSHRRRRPTGEFERLAGLFLLHSDNLNRKPFLTLEDSDSWGSIINPLWVAHLTDVEEAWDHAAESRAVSPQPEKPPENVLFSPRTEALPKTVLVTPVSRDEIFSGPERDQLATPWAHAEGSDCRSTRIVEPLPGRVPPHLNLFFIQLAVPVRCAMRSFSSILPNWSGSVWMLSYLRHASPLLHCAHAKPAFSVGALGATFSAPSYNTAIFPPFCSAPSVGVSSPGGGTRVPFSLVGDVVGY